MAILTVNNIQQSFGEEVILQDISFEMQKGERVGLVGVNGSGKTTLFKVLTGSTPRMPALWSLEKIRCWATWNSTSAGTSTKPPLKR